MYRCVYSINDQSSGIYNSYGHAEIYGYYCKQLHSRAMPLLDWICLLPQSLALCHVLPSQMFQFVVACKMICDLIDLYCMHYSFFITFTNVLENL